MYRFLWIVVTLAALTGCQINSATEVETASIETTQEVQNPLGYDEYIEISTQLIKKDIEDGNYGAWRVTSNVFETELFGINARTTTYSDSGFIFTTLFNHDTLSDVVVTIVEVDDDRVLRGEPIDAGVDINTNLLGVVKTNKFILTDPDTPLEVYTFEASADKLDEQNLAIAFRDTTGDAAISVLPLDKLGDVDITISVPDDFKIDEFAFNDVYADIYNKE